MTQAGVSYSLLNQDVSSGYTSDWIPVSQSDVHSYAYKVASGNVTITVEFGAVVEGSITKLGEDTLVSSGTSTSYDLTGLTMPLCQLVRFVFSGTSTDCSFVFLEG